MEGGQDTRVVGPLVEEGGVVYGWMVARDVEVGIFNTNRRPGDEISV